MATTNSTRIERVVDLHLYANDLRDETWRHRKALESIRLEAALSRTDHVDVTIQRLAEAALQGVE